MVIATAFSKGLSALLRKTLLLATDSNVNRILVDRKMQNMGFYRNMHNFEMVIAVSKTSHICYKPVSTEC